MSDTDKLHLPSLSIRAFRGIDTLTISRLGRVTVLAGMNGVGKTTVLDAVRVYAARGRYNVVHELLADRQEVTVTEDEDGDPVREIDWIALFHGRSIDENASILIGPANGEDQLRISPAPSDEGAEEQLGLIFDPNETPIQILKVMFRDYRHYLGSFRRLRYAGVARHAGVARQRSPGDDDAAPHITCEHIGPGMLGERDMSRFWDRVALTDDERQAVRALEMVIGNEVARVAMIGDGESRVRSSGRRAVIRLESYDRPVPLKSLGDGAVRLFGVALALANSRGGFLLIDEAENGIHHSVQRDFWKMVLATAQMNDVQVLATTHSWDCVRGFAEATRGLEDAEGVLVRLETDDEGLRAFEYTEEVLKIAADQGIEVR